MHRVPAHAQLVHGAGAEIFDQDVGATDHVQGDRPSRVGLQVQADAALVAVEVAEETAGEAAQAAGVIAMRRRLDLDDVGAKVGQHDAAGRPHDGMGKFEDGDAVER